MLCSSKTSTALLEGLFDARNNEVWEEFDARFRPIITGFAHHLGLPPEDAADVAQETLAQFLKDYRAGKYDRSRGRLHSWITGIARNRISDLRRRWATRREQRGASAIADLSDQEHLSRIWDAECRQTVLRRAMDELRDNTKLGPRTIQAFELIAFEERAPAEVAAELTMSLESVYAAKHRCLAQLRAILARLNEIYELV